MWLTCPHPTASQNAAGEMTEPVVGVLALQGGVREHERVLAELGAATRRVRREADLAEVHALVIPGGESSVIDKLARAYGLWEPIRAALARGLPAFGTCAGLILLAERVQDAAPGQRSFGGLDITAQRNAFGRQAESFEVDLSIPSLGADPLRAVFIRAPAVLDTGPDVEILATLDDGHVVAVRHGALVATSFHPELGGDTRFHEWVWEEARRYEAASAG